MEAMKTNADVREEDDAEALDEAIRDALRHLPTELGGPSAETDAAILQTAAARMALIHRRRTIKRAVFGVFATAACLAFALFLTRQSAPSTKSPRETASNEDAAAIILREVSSLFPGQVQAIERDASGLQLSLADTPTVKPGQAVVLEINKNGDSREIITFSGQTINLMGHTVTILTSHDGHIIIKGPGIDWMSGKTNRSLPDLRISARVM